MPCYVVCSQNEYSAENQCDGRACSGRNNADRRNTFNYNETCVVFAYGELTQSSSQTAYVRYM